MAMCDSASCNSTSSVSVTNYVIIRQNEIKNEVYNLATKIAPFVDVQQCRVPAGKTAGYCSCVEYVRERKISSLYCVNQSETSHQGPTATSVTVEMVTFRVGKRSDGQHQKDE